MRRRFAVAAIAVCSILGVAVPSVVQAWTYAPTSPDRGCQVEYSKHSGGFISARGRCRDAAAGVRVQARCYQNGVGTTAWKSGNRVTGSYVISTLPEGSLFCGSQGYQVRILIG
jgi:hypothetical protein